MPNHFHGNYTLLNAYRLRHCIADLVGALTIYVGFDVT